MTRAFYIHVFLPWAKQHRVSSHPTYWYIPWRSDPKHDIVIGPFVDLVVHRRNYAIDYDLIILQSLTRKGNYQKAIELATALREDAAAQEHVAGVLALRGRCLVGLDRPLAAVEDFSEAIRLDPHSAFAHLGRAAAYQMVLDKDRALADCAEAIRLNPADPEGYRVRGNIYQRTGDQSRADADFATPRQMSELWGQKSDIVEASRPKAAGTPGGSRR